MNMIEQLESLLASGQDNALLRFGLGNAYLKAGQPAQAAAHLQVAVQHDPAYSAAWKSLGKALTEAGQPDQAEAAYSEGVRIAEERGDMQAVKEMKVFLKRLQKAG